MTWLALLYEPDSVRVISVSRKIPGIGIASDLSGTDTPLPASCLIGEVRSYSEAILNGGRFLKRVPAG